jgi:hypothetical protein
MRLDESTGLPLLTLEEFKDQFCTEEEVLRGFEYFEHTASWSEPLSVDEETVLPGFPLDRFPRWLAGYSKQVAEAI